MLNVDVQAVVEDEIRELLAEAVGEEDVELAADVELVELGMNSLMLARLIVALETALSVDPFADEAALIADVRTVRELVDVYERALTAAPAGGR